MQEAARMMDGGRFGSIQKGAAPVWLIDCGAGRPWAAPRGPRPSTSRGCGAWPRTPPGSRTAGPGSPATQTGSLDAREESEWGQETGLGPPTAKPGRGVGGGAEGEEAEGALGLLPRPDEELGGVLARHQCLQLGLQPLPFPHQLAGPLFSVRTLSRARKPGSMAPPPMTRMLPARGTRRSTGTRRRASRSSWATDFSSPEPS